jgi:hypothetical protein
MLIMVRRANMGVLIAAGAGNRKGLGDGKESRLRKLNCIPSPLCGVETSEARSLGEGGGGGNGGARGYPLSNSPPQGGRGRFEFAAPASD